MFYLYLDIIQLPFKLTSLHFSCGLQKKKIEQIVTFNHPWSTLSRNRGHRHNTLTWAPICKWFFRRTVEIKMRISVLIKFWSIITMITMENSCPSKRNKSFLYGNFSFFFAVSVLCCWLCVFLLLFLYFIALVIFIQNVSTFHGTFSIQQFPL